VTAESVAGTAWLEDFERRHGRRLRVLHIGNIANNAYINAKIQRSIGIDADVCCYDYYHVMGCPEWEDADFTGDLGDQFFPDWWAVDLHGFSRPRWFAQGRLATCRSYLLALRRSEDTRQRLLWRQLRFEMWLRCRSTHRARLVAALVGVIRSQPPQPNPLPALASTGDAKQLGTRLLSLGGWLARGALFAAAWTVWRIRVSVLRRIVMAIMVATQILRLAGRKSLALGSALYVLARGRGWRSAVLTVFPTRMARVARTPEHLEVIRNATFVASGVESTNDDALLELQTAIGRISDTAHGGERPPLPPEDYLPYLAGASDWRPLLAEYDVIQGYALDPIIPLLAHVPRYAAYEHGTLRDLPFEQSARGHLCALSYLTASTVFITNSDVLPAARRLGLSSAQKVYLPHAVDSDRLLAFANEQRGVRPRAGERVRLFSPTRHDWADGDPLWNKGNDRLIRGFALARDAGIDCDLILVDWGRHVSHSRALIEQLKVAAHVTWIAPRRKKELWRMYMEHHLIIDQFETPAMGSVTFESLALGCRVLTALDTPTIEEFFGESPPILNCHNASTIAVGIQTIVDDPLDTAGLGRRAQEWFMRHHSTARILALELGAYRQLVEGHNREGATADVHV
jgi:glycosyltransferase involved in cell wall biosynthesis